MPYSMVIQEYFWLFGSLFNVSCIELPAHPPGPAEEGGASPLLKLVSACKVKGVTVSKELLYLRDTRSGWYPLQNCISGHAFWISSNISRVTKSVPTWLSSKRICAGSLFAARAGQTRKLRTRIAAGASACEGVCDGSVRLACDSWNLLLATGKWKCRAWVLWRQCWQPPIQILTHQKAILGRLDRKSLDLSRSVTKSTQMWRCSDPNRCSNTRKALVGTGAVIFFSSRIPIRW